MPAPETPKPTATVSRNDLLEMVYDPGDRRTAFVVFEKGSWRTIDAVTRTNGERLVLSAENSLIKHNVVLFPTEPKEYGTTQELVADIRAYIHRYVGLSEPFELLAAHYALFTWVYDRFEELPYLRLRGDFGTGKTRFLITVGSICRTPIFASGASSISPIFQLLDQFRGTLILDEADFRFSAVRVERRKGVQPARLPGLWPETCRDARSLR